MNAYKQIKSEYKRLKLFWQVVLSLVAIIVSLGVVCPSMISSNSTIAVWLGILIAVVTIWTVYDLNSEKIKELINENS